MNIWKHFKTITHHKILVAKGCFKVGLYKQGLLQGAESLSTRFRPQVGCIRSWDWNQKVWEYPVIIDNMMNLEMLMWASKNSDNPKFAEIAKSHLHVTWLFPSGL